MIPTRRQLSRRTRTNRRENGRSGDYAGRILNSAAPRFQPVINLNTAKALDLTLPQSLLQRADEVIE